MTSKKISEFAQETKVRNDDIVLITTGLRTGETPATKIVTKQQLNTSEGAGRVFDAIIGAAPNNYWPMQAPYIEIFDVITGTKATAKNFEGDILRGGILEKYARSCHIFGATKSIETNIDSSHLVENKTVAFIFRNSSSVLQRVLGCSNGTTLNEGWDIALNDPSAGQISFRHFNNSSAFVRISGAFTLNTTDLWVWTFNGITGHNIYKNGVLVITSSNTTPVSFIGTEFAIGSSGSGGATNFPYLGFVQDVALWDRDLTSSEVLSLSNEIMGV